MLQTEGPSSWHRLVSDEQVEQKIDVGHSGVFNKQLRQIQRPGGFCLSVVRKRLVGGATRGPVVLVHGLAQNRYTWHVSARTQEASTIRTAAAACAAATRVRACLRVCIRPCVLEKHL